MRKGCFLVFFLVAGWTCEAAAQFSYQPYVLGLRTSAMGGAAAAFGEDSAMPWLNPAGVARAHADTISLSANALMIEQLMVNRYISLSDQLAIQLGVSDEHARSTLQSTESSIFPTSISYMLHLGEKGNHVLALSLVVPYMRMKNSASELIWEFGGMTLKSIDIRTELRKTYNVGPSYAVRFGRVTIGASAFFRYNQVDRHWSGEGIGWMLSQHALVYSPTNAKASASSYDLEFVIGAQAGPVLEGLYAGLAIHIPSIHLFGNINANTRSYFGDTINDQHLITYTKLDEDDFEIKSPLWFTLGLGYQKYESFAVSADVSYYLPQSKYTNWSGVVEILTVSNDPAGPATFDGIRDKGTAETIGVFNFNVGVEVYVTKHIILRGGFFTDFAAEPELPAELERSNMDVGLSRFDRFGGTFGVAYAGERSQFQLSFIFVGGLGDIIGWEIRGDDAYGYPNREIAWNTYMLAFSGRIDTASIYAALNRAVDEEYDHLKKSDEEEPATTSPPPPPPEAPPPPALEVPERAGPDDAEKTPAPEERTEPVPEKETTPETEKKPGDGSGSP